MKVNLKILAQELNLSIATVSRALRDSHEVSPETKKRIWALAEELNYQANPYASSLRGSKTKTIGVVIPEIANNFFTLAINGIEKVAQLKGYHVLFYLTHDSLEKEISITKHLQSGRVDGILMSVSSETDCSEHLRELNEKIPIVFFDRVCEEIDTPKVVTDDYDGGYKATEHLIECGCKKIAYLQVSENLSIGRKRMQGYIDALQKFNLEYTEKLVIYQRTDEEENYGMIKQLLTEHAPDGIFSSVENLAITSYYVCRDLGLTVPDDIKIISFSNLPTAPLLAPSLTTITQPAFNIGKEAATMLFHLLKKNTYHKYHNLVLQSTLVKRDSTKSHL